MVRPSPPSPWHELLIRPVGAMLNTSLALLALPGRVVGVVCSAERTLAAVHQLVARAEQQLDRTEAIIDRMDEVVNAAHRAIAESTGSPDASARADGASPQVLPGSRGRQGGSPPRPVNVLDRAVIPQLVRMDEIGPDLSEMLARVAALDAMHSRAPTSFRRPAR